MANNHLIGKQIFELELDRPEKSYALQQRISEMVWEKLVPAMATLFDEIVGEEEIVRIEKIELDLGTIDPNADSSADLVDRIIEQLKGKLSKERTLAQTEHDFQDAAQRNYGRQPLRKRYFEIWLYWLEKGALPPYAGRLDAGWLELVFETLGLDDEAITLLATTLKKHPIALERLVLQHRSTDLKSLVELHTGFSQSALLKWVKELRLIYGQLPKGTRPTSFRELEIIFWKSIFKKVILEQKKLESGALATAVFWSAPLIKILHDLPKEVTYDENKFPLLGKIVKERPIPTQGETISKVGPANEDVVVDEITMDSPQFLKMRE